MKSTLCNGRSQSKQPHLATEFKEESPLNQRLKILLIKVGSSNTNSYMLSFSTTSIISDKEKSNDWRMKTNSGLHNKL